MNQYKITLLCLLFLLTSGWINKKTVKPKLEISKQDSAINVNENILKVFSLGQKRLISDILWITTLIESDIEHYQNKDLNSWLYHRFNTIVALDQKFYNAYLFGGQYLDIIKDDLLGAKDIYLKGLSQFPNDYKLNFYAGFLFAFELRDYKIALPIYEKLVKFPQTPEYYVSIYNKLKYSSGEFSLEEIKLSLKNLLEVTDPEKKGLIHKINIELKYVQMDIDLACLNQAENSNCNKFDPNGKAYIKKNGKYIVDGDHIPFGIHHQSEE